MWQQRTWVKFISAMCGLALGGCANSGVPPRKQASEPLPKITGSDTLSLRCLDEPRDAYGRLTTPSGHNSDSFGVAAADADLLGVWVDADDGILTTSFEVDGLSDPPVGNHVIAKWEITLSGQGRDKRAVLLRAQFGDGTGPGWRFSVEKPRRAVGTIQFPKSTHHRVEGNTTLVVTWLLEELPPIPAAGTWFASVDRIDISDGGMALSHYDVCPGRSIETTDFPRNLLAYSVGAKAAPTDANRITQPSTESEAVEPSPSTSTETTERALQEEVTASLFSSGLELMEEDVRKQAGVTASLQDCDPPEPTVAGDQFPCTFNDESGEFTVTVTVERDLTFDWEIVE